MRIEFGTIEEFCEELREAAPDVLHKTVRVRIDRVPEQAEAVSFQVGVWATALVRTGDGDWVLEFGDIAGRDSPGNKSAGSDRATEWQRLVLATARESGLRVRSGKIEVI